MVTSRADIVTVVVAEFHIDLRSGTTPIGNILFQSIYCHFVYRFEYCTCSVHRPDSYGGNRFGATYCCSLYGKCLVAKSLFQAASEVRPFLLKSWI